MYKTWSPKHVLRIYEPCIERPRIYKALLYNISTTLSGTSNIYNNISTAYILFPDQSAQCSNKYDLWLLSCLKDKV